MQLPREATRVENSVAGSHKAGKKNFAYYPAPLSKNNNNNKQKHILIASLRLNIFILYYQDLRTRNQRQPEDETVAYLCIEKY